MCAHRGIIASVYNRNRHQRATPAARPSPGRQTGFQAAVSIAAPVALLGKEFFSKSSTPFMMIAADIDAMVDYRQNAAQFRTWLPDATHVTLHGGSHTGFAGIAAQLML